jgi:hypothetical protein
MPTTKIRLPSLVPPRGSKPIGIDESSGKVIYTMEMLDVQAMKAAKRQRVDSNGRPVFKKHPTTGEEIYPILEMPKPIFRTKRFVLHATASQKVKMIEGFEETVAEISERTNRKRVANFAHDLANEAVRRGFANASEMMDELFKDSVQSTELQQTVFEADEPKDKKKSRR